MSSWRQELSVIYNKGITSNEQIERIADEGLELSAHCFWDKEQRNNKGEQICSPLLVLLAYQFLLHKLRIVTYGSTYSLSSTCPYCGSVNSGKINLEQMEVLTHTDDLNKYFELDLPKTNHHITLRMQTPHMLDDISIRAKEIRKKSPNMTGDPAFLLTVESLIDTVDGISLDAVKKSEFARKLPMMDTNYIISYAEKLNERIGLNTTLDIVCDVCGLDYKSSFRTTSEFFRPTIDIWWQTLRSRKIQADS